MCKCLKTIQVSYQEFAENWQPHGVFHDLRSILLHLTRQDLRRFEMVVKASLTFHDPKRGRFRVNRSSSAPRLPRPLEAYDAVRGGSGFHTGAQCLNS